MLVSDLNGPRQDGWAIHPAQQSITVRGQLNGI
jgi:hypothetical protein